jgi:uncharacterized membrane protein YhaH (DUF805 family)
MAYPPAPAYPPPNAVPTGEPPLWLPYYGIGFGGAIKRFFKKYATFSGRASRSEYWWWALFNAIISAVVWIPLFGALIPLIADAANNPESYTESYSPSNGAIAAFGGGMIIWVLLSGAWGLATFIPSLALTWRRLHDADFAGPWFFLTFAGPGAIVVFVFTLLGPKPNGVRFDQPEGGYAPPPPPPGYGY